MLALTLTADLAGVTNLRPNDTPDSDYYYIFRVQCTSCREIHPNPVSINRFESHELSGSRGEANFVWRCKSCKRESSAAIKAPPKPYEQASPPTKQTLIEFDCRGLELMDFQCTGNWTADAIETKSVFPTVELDDGEWFDYDEKAREVVSIKDVKWEISKV